LRVWAGHNRQTFNFKREGDVRRVSVEEFRITSATASAKEDIKPWALAQTCRTAIPPPRCFRGHG